MNITIGRYIPGDTIIHKSNPVIKLIVNISFIIFVFLVRSFIVLGVLTLISIFLFLVTKLRQKQLFTTFLTTLIIGTFIFGFNIFVLEEGYNKVEASNGGFRVDYTSTSPNGYIFETVNW